jgi:hypothetical protein
MRYDFQSTNKKEYWFWFSHFMPGIWVSIVPNPDMHHYLLINNCISREDHSIMNLPILPEDLQDYIDRVAKLIIYE